MASYRQKAKITDDIDDAYEIVKNVGRVIKENKANILNVINSALKETQL